MNLLSLILIIIITLLGYPIGLLIAKLTEEELKAGKKWFKLIILASIVVILISLVFLRGTTILTPLSFKK